MMTIKCKYCGGTVTLTGAGHGYCDYCGQELTLPTLQDTRFLAMYDRAAHFRAIGEFDRAYSAYQHLIQEHPQDPELHWCLTLCRYGVEYVEDERLSETELGIREFKPTLSRMSFEPIQEDPDYKAALEYADEGSRRLYRQEAGKLARIQSKYLEIARKEAPYDVFISFKAEKPDGTRTQASEMGQEIYEQLTGKGLKVFFSRITLEDKLSEQYEPYIFAALRSARVMLLMADNKDQLNDRWVKNEWSRFLSMAESDRNKVIVPVFRSRGAGPGEGMSPYDFPDVIPTGQAQDMNKIGAMQDLVRGVCKLTGHSEEKQVLVMEGGVTLDNLLRRASHALKDGEFDEALGLIDQALNADPQNGQAYLCQLLAVNRVSSLHDLMSIQLDWSEDKNYARVKQFGGDRQQAELAHFEEECRKEAILRQAKEAADQGMYDLALQDLEQIQGYSDASSLAEQYRKTKEQTEQLAQYHETIRVPEFYLTRRFEEDYPQQAQQWENFKKELDRTQYNKGMIWCFLASIPFLLYAIYVSIQVLNNGYSLDDQCLIWALLGALPCFMDDRKSYGFIRRTLLPFAVLLLLSEFAYILWRRKILPVIIVPAVLILISLLLVGRYLAAGLADLRRKSIVRKSDEFYANTIQPIERKLREEVEAEWAPRIGAENLEELSSIL